MRRVQAETATKRLERARQVCHRVQMLLGNFAARGGMLPLEHKPAYTVVDLLMKHIEELEREADAKGGIPCILFHHFAKVSRSLPHLTCLWRFRMQPSYFGSVCSLCRRGRFPP